MNVKYVVTLIALMLPDPLLAQERVVTIYTYDRMPFFGQLDTETEGFINQITRLVFENAKIPYVFEKVPVNRIFDNLTRPGLSCVAGVFRTPEREQTYAFSADSIYQDSPPHYLIRNTDEAQYAAIKDIKSLLTSGKTLGLVDKYSYGTWIDESVRQYKPPSVVVNIRDDQSAFMQMLVIKRFDFMFASREEASYNLRTNPHFQGVISVKALPDAPAGNIRWIMYNKDFPSDLRARIDNSIPKVKKSKAYRDITTRLDK